MLILELPIKL